MYDKPFHLEIIAPEKVVYQDDAVSFSAPGEEGGFQVLFNHAPLLSSLTIGQLKVKDTGGTDIFYATSGGVVEVRDNEVVALVETAERAQDIDRARAEAARDRAVRRLQEKQAKTDVARAEAALLRALNRLRIAGKV
jgi:F-type H+-transporting ATPase subunit epsilon